jgi:hypothetical protein
VMSPRRISILLAGFFMKRGITIRKFE